MKSRPIITACAILLIATLLIVSLFVCAILRACSEIGKPRPSGPSPLITPSATVSGEGTLIFRSYWDGNYETYRIQADGTGLTNLTNNPDDDQWAVWSSDGSGERPMTAGDGESCKTSPVWSPDGTQFACEIDSDYGPGTGTAIAVRNVDLGQTTYLQTNQFNEFPAWSPDGTRIAFRSRGPGMLKVENIYTANPDGSGLTKLTDDPTRSGAPVWSPDGTRVAHVAQCRNFLVDNGLEIWVLNADGTGEIQLTYNDFEERGLAWSPDSTRIAFYAAGAIFIINADGSAQTQLVALDGSFVRLSWQPIAP